MRVGQCHYEGMYPSEEKYGLKYMTLNPKYKHVRVHCGGVDVISRFLHKIPFPQCYVALYNMIGS